VRCPRFGWSRFCWHHQPWAEVGLATVIALFVGVNATWFIALRGAEFTREIAESLGGSLTPNFDLPSLHAGRPGRDWDRLVTTTCLVTSLR
jgi:hypothetical protein